MTLPLPPAGAPGGCSPTTVAWLDLNAGLKAAATETRHVTRQAKCYFPLSSLLPALHRMALRTNA